MPKILSLDNKPHKAVLYFLGIQLVHFSKDAKDLPFYVGCAICLKLTKRTKKFKTPKAKFFHCFQAHDSSHLGNGIPTLEDELKNLEQLSIANQRRILFKRRNFD